jgi:DNA-binding transcriptional LysR family regulator
MGAVVGAGDIAALRRIRLRDLQMLRAVVEAGSMARAAQALALTQPAISKAISEMERVLGVPLLERSARGVEPTASGRVLLGRGTAMLDELRQGLEEIRFLSDPATGLVRVGATGPMTALVAAVIDRLSRQYPRMAFQVEDGDTRMLFRWLRERSIDLAISRTAADGTEADLHADPLFEDPLVVMTGRRNPLLRRRGPLALADLLDEPWATAPPETFLARMAAQAFVARGLPEPVPPRAVVVRTVQGRLALLRTGRFLSLLPAAMLRFGEQFPGLAALRLDLPDTLRPVSVVTLAGRMPGPAARLFAECARSVAT